MNAFAPITGATNLPSTIDGLTNGPVDSSPSTLYRLEVRKP
jgi:hypothetical protein